MRKLRVGIVGCGLISEAHVRAYLSLADRAEIVACCDPDLEKARARAAMVGPDVRVTSDYRELLDDPEIDSLDLLTPHHIHREQAEAALAAGKHVLLQKPLAKNIEECDAIVRAAESAKGILYYGETHRTMPAGVAARKAINEGRIGRLIATQATYAHWQGGEYLGTAWRYNPQLAGGGALLDGGIHHISLMTTVAGEIEAVSSFTKSIRPELGGEDTSVTNFEYKNGAIGTLLSTHAAGLWGPAPAFMAYGTEGILMISGYWGPLTLHRRDLPDGKELLQSGGPGGFESMVGSFLDVVLDGAENPSTAEGGRHDFAVVMAAYRSAELGRTVRVDEILSA